MWKPLWKSTRWKRAHIQTIYSVMELTIMAGVCKESGKPDTNRIRKYLVANNVVLVNRGSSGAICFLSDLRLKVPMFWDSLLERAAYAELLMPPED